MIASICMRIMFVIIGIGVLFVATASLAKKHMTESFCLFWGLISLLFIAAGIFLQPAEWNRYISWLALVIVFFGILAVLIAGFYFSVRISRLMRQVTELAIQVSLLNQENELLLSRIPDTERRLEITSGEEGK